MTVETPETWTRHLRDVFDSASTPKELLVQASELWHYRYCANTWEYAIPVFRTRMSELWPTHRKETVVVSDLSGILHSCFHVQGCETEHALKMLRNVYKATSPSVFICAIDNGRGKRDLHQDYKAGREERPPEFYAMCEEVKSALRDRGVQLEEHENIEADDVMCSIAWRCQLIEQPCVLATEDKDNWQALGKNTALYSPRNKEYRNADWLLATHRIRPVQCVDWVALVGGKNSLAGCKNVGEKRASDLLEAYGDFAGIVERSSALSPKLRENILEFEKVYDEMKALHTLRRDIPVGWNPGKRQ